MFRRSNPLKAAGTFSLIGFANSPTAFIQRRFYFLMERRMRKTLLTLCIITSTLTACSSHNRGINSVNASQTLLEIRPLEASINVGHKMKGRALCRSLFGFHFDKPEREAYGATLETTKGNEAPDQCTRGAIYNALSQTNADLIIAPQYETDSWKFLCIPFVDVCLYRSSFVEVTGYEGNYTNIKELAPDVIKERQINPAFKATGKSTLSKVLPF